jgi:hypothetical protein
MLPVLTTLPSTAASPMKRIVTVSSSTAPGFFIAAFQPP